MPAFPIMLYHQVSAIPPALDPDGLAVHPDDFARQMAYLHANGYRCIRLIEAVRAYRAGQALPPRTFAITFDDGYRDNLTHALPVLQQHGFTATIFLVPSRVGQTSQWYGLDGAQAFPLMDWGEIAAMQSAGIDFGSHTLTHARLDILPPEDSRHELQASRQMLMEKLEADVPLLAYPYERFTPAVMRIAQEVGYTGALGTSHQPEGPYNLWRVEFGRADADLRRFALKMTRGWHWLTAAKRRARLVRNRLRATANRQTQG